MPKPVQLYSLPGEINDCVYASEKYPLLLDTTGQAAQFLKYRSRYLHVMRKGDFEKESLRKGLVQCMHNGGWLVLDFDKLKPDITQHFVENFFPEQVLSPIDLFLDEVYGTLLRKDDEFAAKVTYEHSAALAEGAFQDRTKCHAPERVADIDSRFEPKDSFRLILASKQEEVSEELASKLYVMKVNVSEREAKANAGVWAGGEGPKAKKSPEQTKLDSELLELAFDGELEEVQKLLDKGADPKAQDGRGCTCLAEAAVKGHLEVVRCLLDWKKPLGTDPNQAGADKRTPLHRAAFHDFVEVTQLLLEGGADPRTKDKQGETAYDLANKDETRGVLSAWDVAKTDALFEERRKAQDIEDEKNVRSDEDRKMLERRKKMEVLSAFVEKGDLSGLEGELLCLEDAKAETFQDGKGCNVLHLAAEYGHLEIAVALIKEHSVSANTRDAKGWTPVAIAAFRGHKKLIRELVALKGDPQLPNAYNKTAYDVAQDEEMKETLQLAANGTTGGGPPPPEPGEGAAAAGAEEGEEGQAKAKAKAKGKAKGKAKAKGKK